jgi:TPR repeat protein
MIHTAKSIHPINILLAAAIALAAPVFADDKQNIDDACHSKLYDVKDYKSAFPLCKQGAEQGRSSSQNSLGYMYYSGLGTPKDDKQAVYWYTKSAEQGDASAQHHLGFMYKIGLGTPKDDKLAVYWYIKAAVQGHASAQGNLGLMYKNGRGIPQNSVVAYAWYNVASAQGDESATINRSNIAKRMTPSQIEKAQALSNVFYSKYVKSNAHSP